VNTSRSVPLTLALAIAAFAGATLNASTPNGPTCDDSRHPAILSATPDIPRTK
jgi:hypothetical protein